MWSLCIDYFNTYFAALHVNTSLQELQKPPIQIGAGKHNIQKLVRKSKPLTITIYYQQAGFTKVPVVKSGANNNKFTSLRVKDEIFAVSILQLQKTST